MSNAYKSASLQLMGAYVIVNYLNENVNLENPAEPIKEDIELLNEIERRFKEKERRTYKDAT